MSGLFGKKVISNSEPRIGALRIQTSSRGVPITIAYGVTRVTGNLLWYGDFTPIPHTESEEVGKGGGTEVRSTTYTYTVGLIIGLAEGPLPSSFIGTVWSGKEKTTAAELGLTQFNGSASQSPWGYMTANHPSEARHYRGTAYVAHSAFPLGNSDSLPNLSFELRTARYIVSPAELVEWTFTTTDMGGVSVAPGSVAYGGAGEVPLTAVVRFTFADAGYAGTSYHVSLQDAVAHGVSQAPGFIESANEELIEVDGEALLTGSVWGAGVRTLSYAVFGVVRILSTGETEGQSYTFSVTFYEPAVDFDAGDDDAPSGVAVGVPHLASGGASVKVGASDVAWGVIGLPNNNVRGGPPGGAFTEYAIPSGYVGGCYAKRGGALFVSANTTGSAAAVCKFAVGSGPLVAQSADYSVAVSGAAFVDLATDGVTVWAHGNGAIYPLNASDLSSAGASFATPAGAGPRVFCSSAGALYCFAGQKLYERIAGAWVEVLDAAGSAFDGSLMLHPPGYENGELRAIQEDSAPADSLRWVGIAYLEEVGLADLCEPDVNPADIVADLATHSRYGAGLAAAQLDSLAAFRTYCAASGFLCSPAYTEQRPFREMVQQLARIGNSAPLWSENKLKILPYGDAVVSRTPYLWDGSACVPGTEVTFTPDLTPQYQLGIDDFLAERGQDPLRVTRKRQADAYNVVQVECWDRANDYNPEVVEASDQANIELFGRRVMPPVNMHAICDVAIARKVAQALLQRQLYYRNVYRFRLGWRYVRLEPMDIVGLTYDKLALSQTPVRILTIEESEHGDLDFTAEDLHPGTAHPGVYGAQAGGGYVIDRGEDPGDAIEPVIFQPPIALTAGEPEVWIGTAGEQANWGGCEVWASDDGDSYQRQGVITQPARIGALTHALPAGDDPDTVNTLSVDFSESRAEISSASQLQADARETLMWLDGEILAHSSATLSGVYTYSFGAYLRRGLYCTSRGAHADGVRLMRLDAAVLQLPMDPARVGQTVYVKLRSFNARGGGLQSLEDVTPWSYVVQPTGVPVYNGVVPSPIEAAEVVCVPEGEVYTTAVGSFVLRGRVNCHGRLVLAA